MPVLQSFSMAYRRRRTSKKSKRSKKNSVPSQQEGGFIGAILAATAPLWLPLAVKGVKKILH